MARCPLHSLGSAAAAIILTASAHGDLIHVDESAPPGGDGLSWETAHRFLADALDHAANTTGPDEIRVATGAYAPDQTADAPEGSGDRDATFLFPPDLVLRGGYPGGADGSGGDGPDPLLFPVVLNGDLDGDDFFPEAATYSDNARHVITIPAGTVEIEGVTIRGGSAEGLGDLSGAAILAANVDLTLRNVRIHANIADDSAVRIHGGALTLDACVIEDNACVAFSLADVDTIATDTVFNAHPGPALDGAGDEVVYTFANCVFDECRLDIINAPLIELLQCSFIAQPDPGAPSMLRFTGGLLWCEDTTFTGASPGMPGMYLQNDATVMIDCDAHDFSGHAVIVTAFYTSLTLENCSFTDNTTFKAAVDARNTWVTATDCLFAGNVASVEAGAFHGAADMLNCRFENNRSPAAGAACFDASSLVVNSTFTGNQGGIASAIMTAGFTTAVRFVNCVIAGNEGDGPTPPPHAIVFDSDGQLSNCTIVDNTHADATISVLDTYAITVENSVVDNLAGDDELTLAFGADATVFASLVRGGWTGPGAGVIDAPALIDPATYAPLPGSPCIDAGNNAKQFWDLFDLDGDGDLTEPTSLDRNGSPRMTDNPDAPDTGCGQGAIVDLGAVETPGPTAAPFGPADFSGDGVVNAMDLSLLLAAWGPCPTDCCLPDLTFDEKVDIADLSVFLAAWVESQ